MAQTTLLSLALTPKATVDGPKLLRAVVQLRAEDPSLDVRTDPRTGQIIIGGMGELHLEIAADRLKRAVGVDATVGKPQVIYKQAATGLLEPVMRVEVQVPSEYIAGVIDNLSHRRGKILWRDARDGAQSVAAHVPLSEMLGYAADLRARTIGRGTYAMRLERYQPCSEPGDSDDRASLVGAPRTPAPTLRTSSIALPEPDDDRQDNQTAR